MFAPGMRVVVRYADGGSLTDALGEVLAVSDTHIRIATKRGPVDVPVDAIETGHEIPPAPTRPGKLHEIVSAEDLRKIAAATWSPREIAWLHADNLAAELRGEDPEVLSGWLLRSAPGTSASANSVLPLGDPGIPAEEALTLAVQWLRDRSSTPHVIIHTDAHSTELSQASQSVAPLLRDAGFVPPAASTAFTAPTAELATLREPAGDIVESDEPAPIHMDVWGVDESAREDFAQLLASAPRSRILSAVTTSADGSRDLVGVARVSFAMKWAVVSHLVVHPSMRRRGVGSSLLTAASRMAQVRGVRSLLFDASAGELTDFARACGLHEHHRLWVAEPASA